MAGKLLLGLLVVAVDLRSGKVYLLPRDGMARPGVRRLTNPPSSRTAVIFVGIALPPEEKAPLPGCGWERGNWYHTIW